MTARITHSHCAEVLAGQEIRNAAVTYLKERMHDIGPDWKKMLAPGSLTMSSPCGRKILKVDNTKIFTMDTRTADGWKSVKFSCKTIEEAWAMVTQTVKAFDTQRTRNALH